MEKRKEKKRKTRKIRKKPNVGKEKKKGKGEKMLGEIELDS